MDKKEKVMPEKDKMSLVDALIYLHLLRDILSEPGSRFPELYSQYVEAFNRVFEWIDDISLLLHKKKDAGEIPMENALGAYDTLRDYCYQRGHCCKDCLFHNCGMGCVLMEQDVPEDWVQLEID